MRQNIGLNILEQNREGNSVTLSFSIIVPTFNRRDMLAEALASVWAQNWSRTEIIIVDGGSTDGTVEEYGTRQGVHLISGPDSGVYDALNRGISKAKGDVVGFLNSDDRYGRCAFSSVSRAFASCPEAQAVCGTATLEENNNVLMIFDRELDKRLISPRTALIGSSVWNSRFCRRTALEQIGLFSLEYRYVGDRDWLVRWYEAGLLTIAIPHLICRYRRHPGSLTFAADRTEEAIREDLVRLARHWRTNRNATKETRRVAGLLEGRCVFYLAMAKLRQRHPHLAIKWLCCEDGRLSIWPLISIVLGGIDWVGQQLEKCTSKRLV